MSKENQLKIGQFVDCYFLLFLSSNSTEMIRNFLINQIKVKEESVQRNMHLTVYYGRRKLPIEMGETYLSIKVDIAETRFMVLAPGGENPRPSLKPAKKSVGIRLTRRNLAIPDILKLRRKIYKHESNFLKRSNTTDWINAFGAKTFQPHIKLLRTGSLIDTDLTVIGNEMRKNIKTIEFSKFVQREKIREVE